jgi:hypothetical protein
MELELKAMELAEQETKASMIKKRIKIKTQI